MIWTIIEPGVAIVASSLATIRPLLRAMKIHGFESTGRTHSARSSAHARYAAEDSRPVAPSTAGGRAYGPNNNNFSLKHVGPVYDTATSTRTNVGLTIEHMHSYAGRATAGRRLDTARQEGQRGNEGKEYSPSSSVVTEATNSSSFDEIHNLEAQSQETEYFGYGPGERRR
ncbi:hypothetical protein CCMA1212_002508 [Trichoderma ghanense]|uniref:Uncharacterized protein n=1 Tax=Trichoderma ghanense TaxID=65468 RepID=A0ABY2HBE5_9HYPO